MDCPKYLTAAALLCLAAATFSNLLSACLLPEGTTGAQLLQVLRETPHFGDGAQSADVSAAALLSALWLGCTVHASQMPVCAAKSHGASSCHTGTVDDADGYTVIPSSAMLTPGSYFFMPRPGWKSSLPLPALTLVSLGSAAGVKRDCSSGRVLWEPCTVVCGTVWPVVADARQAGTSALQCLQHSAPGRPYVIRQVRTCHN